MRTRIQHWCEYNNEEIRATFGIRENWINGVVEESPLYCMYLTVDGGSITKSHKDYHHYLDIVTKDLKQRINNEL